MIKKLKQKSGETLVETLFAMLIAVLSMSLLCSAVMAASNINIPAPSHNVSKASSLCSIAIDKYKNNVDVYDCYTINPLYIRKSQAEVQYDEKMKRLSDGK